jgi:hypothetical protein
LGRTGVPQRTSKCHKPMGNEIRRENNEALSILGSMSGILLIEPIMRVIEVFPRLPDHPADLPLEAAPHL